MRTINDEWEAMLIELKRIEAPDFQIREMRKAFFYGAYMMSNIFFTLDAPGVDDEAAEAALDLSCDQLDEFASEFDMVKH